MSAQKPTNATASNASSVSLALIINQLAEGSTQAIAQVYRLFFHKLLYYGHQVVSEEHHDKVEDAIQEFFIWLTQNYPKVAQIRNFESYMFMAVRRNLMAKLSQERRSQVSKERYLDFTHNLEEEISSPESEQIQLEEKSERSAALKDAIAHLPTYQREILYLRYFEGKSYAEIAEILDISEQVAYNYVSRAIKRLRKYLGNFALVLSFMIGLWCLFR